jgi:hypothetical protein
MTLVKLYNFCLRKLGLVRLEKFHRVCDIDSVAFNCSIKCCRKMVFSVLVVVFFIDYRFSSTICSIKTMCQLDCFYKTTHHFSLRHTQRVVVKILGCICLSVSSKIVFIYFFTLKWI